MWVVALLTVGVVACNDGSSDSATVDEPGASVTASTNDDDRSGGTTVLDTTPSVDSVAESASWAAASSLTGELTQIVSWSDGFAAIMNAGGDDPPGEGGELWYSADGVDWEAAVVRPFGLTDDIYSVFGQDDQLFAMSGDIGDYEDGTPQTLWHRRSGEPWEEIMTDDALHRIAVNPDRLIAYRWDPLGIVGVFDTATIEALEFLDVSESLPAGGSMYGDVIALDEGFLATARRPTGLDADQPDPILLYSADGTEWDQHPSPPPGGVGITAGQAMAPTFDGRNLVPSFSLLFPPKVGAWVTDTGMTFEPLPDPVTDEVVAPPAGANLVVHTNGTEAGFFAVENGVIYQSLDGLDWTTLESPPTWSSAALAGHDKRGLAHGTILATDDSLIAVGVHGQYEAWAGLVNPSTDIWITER